MTVRESICRGCRHCPHRPRSPRLPGRPLRRVSDPAVNTTSRDASRLATTRIPARCSRACERPHKPRPSVDRGHAAYALIDVPGCDGDALRPPTLRCSRVELGPELDRPFDTEWEDARRVLAVRLPMFKACVVWRSIASGASKVSRGWSHTVRCVTIRDLPLAALAS